MPHCRVPAAADLLPQTPDFPQLSWQETAEAKHCSDRCPNSESLLSPLPAVASSLCLHNHSSLSFRKKRQQRLFLCSWGCPSSFPSKERSYQRYSLRSFFLELQTSESLHHSVKCLRKRSLAASGPSFRRLLTQTLHHLSVSSQCSWVCWWCFEGGSHYVAQIDF